MLVALGMLSNLGILHADIKPNNIMLVNRWEQPLRVKLIDFGLAIPTNCTTLGMQLQPTGFRYVSSGSSRRLEMMKLFKYSICWQRCHWLALRLLRAPEVSLGLPISQAIDLWGLGCTLGYLFLGEHLFSTSSKFQMVRWKSSDNKHLKKSSSRVTSDCK